MSLVIERETCVRTPEASSGDRRKPPTKPPVRIAAAASDDEPEPFGRPLLGYQPRGIE